MDGWELTALPRIETGRAQKTRGIRPPLRPEVLAGSSRSSAELAESRERSVSPELDTLLPDTHG
jgi:hypothetical protein